MLSTMLLFLVSGCSGQFSGRAASSSTTNNTEPVVSTEPAAVIQEDFEQEQSKGLYSELVRHPKLSIVAGTGVNNSMGLEAAYVGYHRGSERIVLGYPLGQRGLAYTLCYDVRFDDEFQFVRGGKIMGLGPDDKITGGNVVTPGGWSARSNFAREGKVHTYIYSQNKTSKWGVSEHSEAHVFIPGEFQKVSLQVQLNEPATAINGLAKIYIDGELHVTHSNIQFRKVAGDSTLISTLMFETFHGGSTPDYAPRDANGEYTTVKAYFDNIEVYQELQVCEREQTN